MDITLLKNGESAIIPISFLSHESLSISFNGAEVDHRGYFLTMDNKIVCHFTHEQFNLVKESQGRYILVRKVETWQERTIKSQEKQLKLLWEYVEGIEKKEEIDREHF